MTDRKATSIRLSAEADRLLDELNAQLGAKSRTAVIELAIRQLAKETELGILRNALIEERARGNYHSEVAGQWEDASERLQADYRTQARKHLQDEGYRL